ncbi:MAG: hypothetical protein ACI4N3_04285 [Alphaproteobacteria bacterium]
MSKKRKEEIKQKRKKEYTEMFKLHIYNIVNDNKGWKSRSDYKRILEEVKGYLDTYEQDIIQDVISYEDVYKIFILDVTNTNYPIKIKKQLLNEIRQDLFPSAFKYENKETQTEETRIEYIKKYPERIITDITKENYRRQLTIYDLNREELKVYKESMENLIKKAEENLNTKNDSSELTKGIKILPFMKWYKNQR